MKGSRRRYFARRNYCTGVGDQSRIRNAGGLHTELFQRGTEMAAEMGLILVDTKYEFGKKDGKIYLIDEIHTPDSSRYFYADGYQERLATKEKTKNNSQKNLCVNG